MQERLVRSEMNLKTLKIEKIRRKETKLTLLE